MQAASVLLLLQIVMSDPIYVGSRFELVLEDAWQHDKTLGGRLFASAVDHDGDMIAQFQRDLTFIANKERVADFRSVGEGPEDLNSCFGVDQISADKIAIMEHTGRRIKIFKKENGAYQWDETVHRNAIKSFHTVNDLAFFEDRWFVGGVSAWPKEDNPKEPVNYHILVLNRDGSFLTNLLSTEHEKGLRYHWFLYYLKRHEDRLYFMTENDLVIHVISPKDLKVLKSQRLKPPPYYKPIPEDAYRTRLANNAFEATLSEWRTSYSSVTNFGVANGHLMVQLRTASPTRLRFGLLIYDLETLDLKDTLFTNDQMVAQSGDRFYFLKNGMPFDDDDAGPFHIEIRRLVSK